MLRVQMEGPYQQIHNEVFHKVQNIDSAIKISKLLKNLCAIGIQNISIDPSNNNQWDHVKVTVNLNHEQHKQLNGAELYIPQTLMFDIDKHGISFDRDGYYTPCQIQDSCCSALLNRLTWMDISVEENDFVFASPRWVGIGAAFAGGTPNVYRIPIEDVLEATRS